MTQTPESQSDGDVRTEPSSWRSRLVKGQDSDPQLSPTAMADYLLFVNAVVRTVRPYHPSCRSYKYVKALGTDEHVYCVYRSKANFESAGRVSLFDQKHWCSARLRIV